MQDLDFALKQLREGKPVAVPTETVYGLAADAKNPKAIEQVFTLKNRPSDHPVIVHIASSDDLNSWCKELSPEAKLLAKHFWPGPLTLICKRQPHVLDSVTAGQESIAIRCPDHPLTLELIKNFGGGLIAPSANPYGRLSSSSANHVRDYFGDEVYVLDGGKCKLGIESTIVDVRSTPYQILRPGLITASDLKKLCPNIEFVYTKKSKTKAPGLKASHYAPRTRIQLISKNEIPNTDTSNSALVLLDDGAVHSLPNNPRDYASKLYPLLHELDKQNFSVIFIETPPDTEEWQGVLDRLKRAAKN